MGEPWKKDPQIVLGVDIGTTRSAVSFAFLFPGGIVSAKRVTDWPGEREQQGTSEVPTQLYYDVYGEAVKCGAETIGSEVEDEASENRWHLVKHFKLHLHPASMKGKQYFEIDPLPDGVPLLKIYTDFIRHLFAHTKQFFFQHVLDGKNTWEKYAPTMVVVIAHPNGWGTKEHGFLRDAAVAAGYTSAQDATCHIRFVSEAEASVHFCLVHASNIDAILNPGAEFVVCDAGGSTIDTTVYGVTAKQPVLTLEEKKPSACVQAGGIFVDQAAEEYFTSVLKQANFDEDVCSDFVKTAVDHFQRGAKKAFVDAAKPLTVSVGDRRFNMPNIGVRRGILTLPGAVIKDFFESRIEEIVDSIRHQVSGLNVKYVLLVGGFGESPFLRETLVGHLGPTGVQVTHVKDGRSKAVADGAVVWFAQMSVISRATRFAYGIEIGIIYNPLDNNHQGRGTYSDPMGAVRISGAWGQIVPRGQVMDMTTVIRQPYFNWYTTAVPGVRSLEVKVYAYTPDGLPPSMLLNTKNELNRGFIEVCQVRASLGDLDHALVEKQGSLGPYWELKVDYAIRFGGTELQSFVEWNQGGETRSGPATVIPPAYT